MTTTVDADCRTYTTDQAARILGVSPGLLYKISREGPRRRPEYDRYGCIRTGRRSTWSREKVDAVAPPKRAAA